jgi:outer membrane protein OmpA-like peptidoglycan-associated protein
MRNLVRYTAFAALAAITLASLSGCGIAHRIKAYYKPKPHVIVVNSEPEVYAERRVDVAANIGVESDDEPRPVLSDAATQWPPPRNVIPAKAPPSAMDKWAVAERIPLRAERMFKSASKSPRLTPAGKQELDRLAFQLAKYDQEQLVNIAIVDYSATQKEARTAQQRADTVKDYLAKKGVRPALLKSSAQRPVKVAANCKGKKKAQAPGCAERNSRIEVVVRRRT